MEHSNIFDEPHYINIDTRCWERWYDLFIYRRYRVRKFHFISSGGSNKMRFTFGRLMEYENKQILDRRTLLDTTLF